MPGLFIDVKVSDAVAKDAAVAAKLAEVCPVSIFEATNAGVAILEENLDECTLCDLCLEAAPKGSIEIIKINRLVLDKHLLAATNRNGHPPLSGRGSGHRAGFGQ